MRAVNVHTRGAAGQAQGFSLGIWMLTWERKAITALQERHFQEENTPRKRYEDKACRNPDPGTCVGRMSVKLISCVSSLQDGTTISTGMGTRAHVTINEEPSHPKNSQAQMASLSTKSLPCMAPQTGHSQTVLHGFISSSRTTCPSPSSY